MSPSFILDCSVTMAWCFEDEASPYADKVLASLQYCEAIVPALWTLEVTNVLLMAERKKRLKEAGMIHFSHLLSQLPIHIDEAVPNITDLLLLGRMHQLTSYDTSYLALSLGKGLPLATLDKNLKQAAVKANVPLYKPSKK